jgi:hypothetical protein
MSFISALKGDIKKAFAWLAGPTAKAVIAAGEGAVEDVWPGATGLINIINTWFTKAITVETLADAAESNSGTGAQKAAILIADLTPVLLADAKDAGLPAPSAETISEVNAAVVLIINLLTGAKTAGTATPAAAA